MCLFFDAEENVTQVIYRIHSRYFSTCECECVREEYHVCDDYMSSS